MNQSRLVGLILAKSDSKRLPGKNKMLFKGRPMLTWNIEKCLEIFNDVYVSSDSEEILELAERWGAIGIQRGKELCGETPNIPVYQHALKRMGRVDGIVAVHANNPLIDPNLIRFVKKALEGGASEVMTCHPVEHGEAYKEQGAKIYGSIWGIKADKLVRYKDPYKPSPDILCVDKSIEVETIKDLKCL